MSTDAELRVARAVRALADAVPVVPPDPAELIARATGDSRSVPGRSRPGPVGARRRRTAGTWSGPLVTAAAVLTVLAVATVGPGLVGERRPGGSAGAPILPAAPAALSLLTASVTDSPPGPVALSYGQGNSGPKSLHWSQTVVVGVDGRTYRRVDLAERRGHRVELGTWQDAAVLLSPDGTRLAVGSELEVRSVPVQDLRTGRVRDYPIPQRGAVEVLAWSPDGTRLAYGVRPVTPFGTEPPPTAAAEVAILDLPTGATTGVGGTASAAAFSPDGGRLAVQGDHDDQNADGRRIRLVNLSTGSPGGQVALLPDAGYAVRLAGSTAWSPDGRWLAVVDDAGSGKQQGSIAFLPAGGTAGTPPPPVPVPGTGSDVELLGWRSADRVLLTADPAQGQGRSAYEAVLGGDARPVLRIRAGLLDDGTSYGMRVATALLPDAQIRAVGPVDRGPWPVWWWLTLAAGGMLLVGCGWLLVRRGRRRAGRSAVSSPDRR